MQTRPTTMISSTSVSRSCRANPTLTGACGFRRLDFEAGRVQLLLALGDVQDLLHDLVVRVDAFYLDGGQLTKSQTVEAGQPVTLTLGGAAPGSTVDVTLYSDPVPLGQATAGSDGSFVEPFTIPAGTSLGEEQAIVRAGHLQEAADHVRSPQLPRPVVAQGGHRAIGEQRQDVPRRRDLRDGHRSLGPQWKGRAEGRETEKEHERRAPHRLSIGRGSGVVWCHDR